LSRIDEREPDLSAEEPERLSEDGFGRRLARFARVGSTVAGQAARLAGRRIGGGPFDRGAHAAELRAALGGLKGPLMKVAQMLATIPEALPAEYAAELAQLQSQAPAMGKPFVRRRMATELGPDWAGRFADFPLDAAAAASLGQVHKARLADGRTVACKLQYPNIEATVEADLSQLRLILGIYRRFDPSIGTEKIYEEISARLREELDYRREARAIGLYREMLAGEAHVHVPEVVPELSTDRLLTMTWLDGAPLLEFKAADQATRDKLAYNMFRAWYVPFYYYGVIHGDPHLGNYTVRPDLDVNLLDFGCIRIFPARFVKGVIDLYWALVKDDRALAISAYETWGFSGLTDDLVDILSEWARFLYGPLMDDRKRRIQEQPSGQQGRRVAEHVHQRLREAGGVTVPREFVFMDRAAIGLGSVFLHLAAEINWHELFMSLIRDFDVDALERRQRAALGAAGFTVPG
jgi:predicted unusual protein kinase regulating ubiquinone biosynthesis (AarF/ABC1/UbiB family)